MGRWITRLDPFIVSTRDDDTIPIDEDRPDGDATFVP